VFAAFQNLWRRGKVSAATLTPNEWKNRRGGLANLNPPHSKYKANNSQLQNVPFIIIIISTAGDIVEVNLT